MEADAHPARLSRNSLFWTKREHGIVRNRILLAFFQGREDGGFVVLKGGLSGTDLRGWLVGQTKFLEKSTEQSSALGG